MGRIEARRGLIGSGLIGVRWGLGGGDGGGYVYLIELTIITNVLPDPRITVQ